MRDEETALSAAHLKNCADGWNEDARPVLFHLDSVHARGRLSPEVASASIKAAPLYIKVSTK